MLEDEQLCFLGIRDGKECKAMHYEVQQEKKSYIWTVNFILPQATIP